MSFFTSDRERNLWFLVLATVIAIYSSLGYVRDIAAFLRERSLVNLSIGMIISVFLGVIAWRWIRSRPRLGEIGVAFGIASVYLIAWIRIPIPEERTHLIEYSLVAILIYLALSERKRNGQRVTSPPVLAIVATDIFGLIDECLQAILPNRHFDFLDVGFNAGSGLMAILAILTISWARQWQDQFHKNRGYQPRKDKG